MFDEYLNDILYKISFKNEEKFFVKDVLSKIKNDLEILLEYDIETNLIGSIYKDTAIDKKFDENFDIDVLLIPKNNDDFFKIKELLKKKYLNNCIIKPEINKIFIKYKDYLVDIILGYKENNYYRIPDMKSTNNYILFDFIEEKNFLNKLDEDNKFFMIKIIKIIKYLNNCFNFGFSSYGIEKSVLKSYYSKLNVSLTDYLFEFLTNLKENPKYTNIANENIKNIHVSINSIKNTDSNIFQIKKIVPDDFI